MRAFICAVLLIISGLATPAIAAVGDKCGGFAGAACGDGEYCRYTVAEACGVGDVQGVCAKKPTICNMMFIPVCGCDGKTFPNECSAAANGVSVAYVGACRASSKTECIQQVTCGIKDGAAKEYPTPCDAVADGATNIQPKKGDSCPVLQ